MGRDIRQGDFWRCSFCQWLNTAAEGYCRCGLAQPGSGLPDKPRFPQHPDGERRLLGRLETTESRSARVGEHVVWKYTMTGPRTTFSMPLGTEILSVGVQADGQLVMWAELDPEDEQESRTFEAVNTGGRLPADRKRFIGTAQVASVIGEVVWHVYEVDN